MICRSRSCPKYTDRVSPPTNSTKVMFACKFCMHMYLFMYLFVNIVYPIHLNFISEGCDIKNNINLVLRSDLLWARTLII